MVETAPARPTWKRKRHRSDSSTAPTSPTEVLIPQCWCALANAGVAWSSGVFGTHGRLTSAIALGLVVGKSVAIVTFAWLAVRSGLAVKPDAYSWRHLCGAGVLGGIGFTMSLFIASAAFPDPADRTAAKIIGYWCDRILGYRPHPTFGVVLDFFRQDAATTDPLDLVTDSTSNGQPQHVGVWHLNPPNTLSRHYTIARLRVAIGMLLCSPEFLRR